LGIVVGLERSVKKI